MTPDERGNPRGRRRRPPEVKPPRKLEDETKELERRKAEILATPLANTDLEVRAINTLERIGIFTIGDVVIKEARKLIETPNFGRSNFNKLVKVLADKGVYIPAWGMKPPKNAK